VSISHFSFFFHSFFSLTQDLNPHITWVNGNGRVATWSRLLNTGDTTGDQIIAAGDMMLIWAVGNNSPNLRWMAWVMAATGN
jgi:hypothetical protein